MKLFRRFKKQVQEQVPAQASAPAPVPTFMLSASRPFEGSRLDALVALVSRKDFSLFLEYLDFTAQEKALKLSSMNLNDPKVLMDARALQAYMAGLTSVGSIVEYLKTLKEDKRS